MTGREDTKNREFELQQIIQKATNFADKGIRDSALLYYSEVYSKYSAYQTSREQYYCAMAYLGSAKILYHSCNFTESLRLLLSGLKIIEKCGNQKKIAEFYIEMANIYWLSQDQETAKKCYEMGLEFAEEQKDTISMIRLFNLLTGVNCYLKHDVEAKINLQKANKLNRGSLLQENTNLFYNGLFQLNAQNYDKAAEYFRKSASHARTHNVSLDYECSAYEELYKLYMKTGERDSVRKYLFKCYEILQEIPFVSMLPNCLKSMSDFYKQSSDYRTAYDYICEYQEIMDSVFRYREINNLRNIHTMYEIDKKNSEITILQDRTAEKEKTIQKQSVAIGGMVIGLLGILSVAIYIYRKKQELTFLYRKLFDMNRDISASEQYNRDLRIKYERILVEKETQIERMEEKLKDVSRPVSEEQQKDGSRKALKKMDEERKRSLQAAIDEIMENSTEFCSVDFSLDKLAELVHSNNTYVSQIINENYNRTFYSLVNEYRIKEAQRRLLDEKNYGHLTIKAISESVGYKSQTTFIKIFKETTGMTPSMYQKIAQKS